MGTSTGEKPSATSAAGAATSPRRVGVADYFTILGVGKTLIWKHAQKKSAGSTSPAASNETSGVDDDKQNNDNDDTDVPPTEVQEEDDAALLERFYREIVDVSIVAVPVMDATTNTATSTLVGTTTTAGNYSHVTDYRSQSFQQNSHHHSAGGGVDVSTSLSIPPSLSFVTSDVTGTDIPELHGFHILRQTLPTGSAEPPPPRNISAPQHQQPQPSPPQKPLPHSPLWSKSQVFEANLDPISGISGELQAMHVELQQTLEKRAKEAGRQGSIAPITALKDIRRKVQSTLRLRQSGRGNKKTLHGGSGTDKFYLGLRRRAPDESTRPAIANIKLCHVKLHKATCLHMSMADASTTESTTGNSLLGSQAGANTTGSTAGSIVASSLYQTGSTAAALVGRAALGGAQVVRDRMVGKTSPSINPSMTSSHYPEHSFGEDHGDSSRIVNLGDIPQVPVSEFLDLPYGFDEWSIPELFKYIRLPPPPSEDECTDNHAQTLLFPPDDDVSESSGGSGVGVEAVERPLRRNDETAGQPPDDNSTTQQDRKLKEWKSRILPKLVKDITTIPTTSMIPEMDEDEFVYIPIIAVRRQRVGDEERFHEDAALVDLTVTFCDRTGLAVLPEETMDDEDFEEDRNGTFNLLGKTPWTVATSPISPSKESEHNMRYSAHGTPHHQNENNRWLGATTILVKRNIPLGFCDAAFATRVLDRFPDRNYKGLPLPEEELPMFCYPTGCRLHRARFSDAPLAQYYGFCVKNERGDSIYVSCVSFMEPLTKTKVEQLAKMSEKRQRVSLPHRLYCERRHSQFRTGGGGHDKDKAIYNDPNPIGFEDDTNFLLTGFDEMTTFENKTICLVSRYPFWTAFRRFLSHLHVLSGSSSDLPLERCISHLLLTVPIPKAGGPSILIPLPTLNAPMVLFAPPLKDLPLVDLPFDRLMACLDIPTIVTIVLGFLALERKVIVMSTRPSLVLDACELLRSLLFPFELCAPYVPRLTEPFMSCLDFPGAIFVGIHDDGTPDGLAAVVRKNMPEDSTIVDLDCGSVDCSGNRITVLDSSWGIIPPDPRAVLVSELETLCRDSGIAPGQEPLDSQIDSAFDASIPPALVEDEGTSHTIREPLDDRAVRDAFLRFFCSVLGGYERFLVVPDVDFLISGNEWFDSKGFLASASEENAVFLGALVSTQLFQSFIQRRTEASDVHCLLFDECLAEFHSSPVPYGRLGGDVETVASVGSGQPHMMYSLLVDQSATEPQLAMGTDRSFDGDSKPESDTDSSTLPTVAKSTLSISETSDRPSIKAFDFVVNTQGDWVTVPSRQDLPEGKRFIYCVDGNPSFPDRLDPNMYLPRQPESWLVEMSEAPSPLLARSEKEVEEAERRRKLATSYRGLQSQRRCLWQLPKLMGSHFLGSWLLCVPAQVAQPHLSHEQQSKYLLRALGALRLLRSKQRIVPDEAAYRALMVACGRTRNDRRTELVRLFGLLRSDGIFPSAVTLGQYTRALAEGYSKRSMGTADEDTVGVEVTESASKDLRVGTVRKGTMDAEVALSALDGSLGNLEEAGRRWRQKNSPDKDGGHAGDDPSISNDSKSQTERQKKRVNLKPWLPVLFSSSFVPAKQAASGSLETRPLSADSICLLAIWSRTKACDSCGYIPLEEEIQAGWDVVGGENDIPGAISCPRCGALVIPMLGYKEMSVEQASKGFDSPPSISKPEGSSIADFDDLPPQIGPVLEAPDAAYVTYISPASLRLSLERHIEEHGEEVLEREHLKTIDPELFYNFWWYCARFSLPLPLPVAMPGDKHPMHCCMFAAWDHRVAERGCYSCAKSLTPYLVNESTGTSSYDEPGVQPVESFEDFPLMSRFNLQGYFSTVWDHGDLSEILVTLVEACDKRDFKPVVECLLRCNKRRRETYGGLSTSSSDVNSSFSLHNRSSGGEFQSSNFELDCYRTILYLAKYQCTTAFHVFFPATLKACKGYHFWCPIAPLPIFDRLLREAVKRVRAKDNSFTPIYDVSDVALGFRCVFGHII